MGIRRVLEATGPGQSAVTVTPAPLTSWCRPSANTSAKLLAPAYSAFPGSGWKAAVDAVTSTAPAPRSTIPGSQRAVRSTTASVLTRVSSIRRSRGISTNGL